MQYQLVTYDIWGSGSDRYVNAAYTTSVFIEVDEHTSDMAINRRLGARGITWDGEHGYTLYGNSKRNGSPVCELRAVTD
jgi:hypothetical protein